jgi:hypothetical protein
MLNKLKDLLDHLNALPSSAEGFDAKTLYTTGMEFGLTCKEVKDTLLGKEKALARGKYPAAVSAAVLEAATNAPVKTPKVKAPKVAKKAAKTAAKTAAKPAAKPKAGRNTSTAVVEKKSAKDSAALAGRRELIAKIAKRHKAEDKVVAELTGESKSASSLTDSDTIEELEKLTNASTVNPLTA